MRNIDQDEFPGSSNVYLHIKTSDGTRKLLGVQSIFNRWNRKNCPNCQKHRYTAVVFRWEDSDGDDHDPFNKNNFDISMSVRDTSVGKFKLVPIDLYNTDETKPVVKFFISFEEM